MPVYVSMAASEGVPDPPSKKVTELIPGCAPI
jgi:hypothetical protein